jgi:tRNA-specific 2-thiouridylase
MQLFQHPQNIADAKIAADKLGIPHYVCDFRQEFQDQIIRYFCQEYTAGRTPNPCVFCNPQIKFGLLFEKVKEFGAHLMATGHYVKVDYDESTQRYLLRSATTSAKDQSYFLYRLTQEQLARSLFPLASMTKEMIRHKARALNLEHVAAKAESQENCFVGGQSYQQFLEEYLTPEMKKPGPIVDTTGKVLGQHQGIYLYTIGQRRGLGIALGTPKYVAAIQPEKNTIVIGEDADLFTQEFFVRDLNFIAIDRLTAPMQVEVKIRYRNPATPARIIPGNHHDEVKVILKTPQRAVTPGQSAVFYQDDIVVGGGIIQ